VKGYPIFAGISEVDMLFQIFSKTGTPTEAIFEGLPNWERSVFPDWQFVSSVRLPLQLPYPFVIIC
jgi:hypothetical protein